MKTFVTLICVVTFLAAFSIGAEPRVSKKTFVSNRVTAKPVSPRIRKFMRAKLSASQNVLEGLVTEDYGKIEKGAQTMLIMSKAADFQVFPTATYSQYAGEFRRSIERLRTMAKKKQLDSAALSYMHVTMTCVNCHKYVAKEKVALREPISPALKFALKQDGLRNRVKRK
jgi:hypothetical protein